MTARAIKTTGSAEYMVGRRFGRRVVTGEAPGKDKWSVRCDCGAAGVARGTHLRGGRAKSCGCIQREHAADRLRVHGLRHRPEYLVWKGMKNRCESPRSPAYARYGGRGISVCESWSKSFEAFLNDMGPRPSALHSVERLDNDGDYAPGNCAWATRKEQNRNQRRTRRVTVDGVTKSAADWEDEAGMRRKRVAARIDLGWSPRDAVSKPVKKIVKLTPDKRKAILEEYAAGGASMSALGRKYGVHNTTIRDLVLRRSWRSS